MVGRPSIRQVAEERIPSVRRARFDKVKHFLDFLEYTWANSVVAYNRDSRQNLVNNTERAW